MAYTTNKNIKQLDASTGPTPADLLPLWDAVTQTTKKATVAQLDSAVFRTRSATTSGTATTGTPDKQLMLFSLNADTSLNAIERTSITSLKAMVAPTSINGAIIQSGTIDASKLSGLIPPGLVPVITANLLPNDIPASKLTGPLSSTVTLPTGFVTASALPAVLDLSGKTVTLANGAVTAPMLASALDLSGKTSVLLPAKSVTTAMMADTLNFTGKTVTLPAGTALPALAANTVSTGNIVANSVTPAKMALGGKELVSAYAKISCDIFASKAINFTVKTPFFQRTTSNPRRIFVHTTDTGYAVGDWVCFGITSVRSSYLSAPNESPMPLTNFSQQAFSPLVAAEKPFLYLNDFDLGGELAATSMSAGSRYVIKTLGTTAWGTLNATGTPSLVGAVGESFTYGSGATGNGTVYAIQNEQPGIWKIVAVNPGSYFEVECPGVAPSGTLTPPTTYQVTVVRLQASQGIYKVGRIPGVGKYRAIFGTAAGATPRADANYVFMPSAQTAADLTVSCGINSTTTKYTDFLSTSAADEISFIVAG